MATIDHCLCGHQQLHCTTVRITLQVCSEMFSGLVSVSLNTYYNIAMFNASSKRKMEWTQSPLTFACFN